MRNAGRTERLALVVDLVPDLIAYVDASERYQLVNAAYAAWFGLRTEDVVGRTLRETLGEAMYAGIEPHLRATLAGAEVRFDTQIPTRDGGARWVDARYVPHRDARGEVIGFAVVVHDVDERQRARARMQQAFTQLPAIVSVARGADHVIEAVSPDAAATLGPLATIGRPLRELVAELGAGAPVLDLYDRVRATGDVVRTPGTRYVLRGRERIFDSTFQPLRGDDGEVEGVIAFSIDVTERALAVRRQDLLARAARVLSEALEPGALLDAAVALIVPALGDDAAVYLRDAQGAPLAVRAAGDARMSEEIVRVVETGRSVLSTPPTGVLETDVRVTVPIASGGRVLGAIALSSATRIHAAEDVALAEEIARFTGAALERARTRDVEAERARDAERLRALAEISRGFAEASLDPELAYAAVARIGAEKLGALAAVNLLTPDGEWLESVALHHRDPERLALARSSFAAPTPVAASLNGVAVRTRRTAQLRLGDAPSLPTTDAGRRYLEAAGVREVVAAPLEVRGRVIGTLAVTLEREAEGALDVALLEEIAQRAALLIESARLFRASQDATRVRDELVATVSHELRTPLNAILGWTAIARQRSDDPALVARALETIERNARAQAQLVDDLLDVARVAGAPPQLERVEIDPEPIVRAAVDGLRPIAERRAIVVALDAAGPCPTVRADAARLYQIVTNLLSNAVKFSRDGGQVRVHLGARGEALELRVEDDGVGIDPAFLPHVFERFRQARATTAGGKGGLGLGLAIVRHLVEAHGGSVSAASEGAGRGAQLVVRLPLSAPARAARPASDAGGTDAVRLDGVRVLLVEDDDDTREALRAALLALGAHVVDAPDGADALRALDGLPPGAIPDVIVSDVAMPRLDGYGFLRAVRARRPEQGGIVPAIAMTAFARPEDAWRAREAGFQVHLGKPTDPPTIARAIAALTAHRAS